VGKEGKGREGHEGRRGMEGGEGGEGEGRGEGKGGSLVLTPCSFPTTRTLDSWPTIVKCC
jgi:hypothetical protein